MPRLENWSIAYLDMNPFLAPECQSVYLNGNAYGHPNFEDGTYISTSSVQEIDYENSVAYTRNTKYELGNLNPEYEQWLIENGHNLELVEKFRNK